MATGLGSAMPKKYQIQAAKRVRPQKVSGLLLTKWIKAKLS